MTEKIRGDLGVLGKDRITCFEAPTPHHNQPDRPIWYSAYLALINATRTRPDWISASTP